MKAKSRVVTFRMDQATWEFMRQLVPYTRYRKASSFIREGIELLLKQEEEQPSGWSVGRPRRRRESVQPGAIDVLGNFRRSPKAGASPSNL